MPANCDEECAAVFLSFWADCKARLEQFSAVWSGLQQLGGRSEPP
jgi:hypothetical protein